ncbi:hypothetical protein BDV25DRAFT_143386 [Aspergillus avenaceus]|uniref:Jacalin-type lectin domain-containing protein n=1 Tax=Aspergillus avenaceus TaxID=36643 RepID=A0A5N6TKX7_ASPAV|nr:hypothetical protein BDV25DRAFT_143386 [Aspergillus avenaceus]
MASKIPLPQFKGPATAEAITTFFQECDTQFEDYEDFEATTLPDRTKIRQAAKAFGDDADMEDDRSKGLKDWYALKRTDLDSGSWDGFKDELKAHLMGPTWRLQILKDFFTHEQNGFGLDEYVNLYNRRRLNLSRTSKMPAVTDDLYKCLLLFRASQSTYENLLDDEADEQWLLSAKVSDLLLKLKKYDSGKQPGSGGDGSGQNGSGQNGSSPSPLSYPQLTAAQTPYMVSTLYSKTASEIGLTATDASTHLNGLPDNPRSLGHLRRVVTKINTSTQLPTVQRLGVDYAGVPWLWAGSESHNNQSYDFNIDAGDYLKSVQVTRRTWLSAVVHVQYTTAKGKSQSYGTSGQEWTTLTAPDGWRIVGFHAMAGSLNRYSTDWHLTAKLGVIYAPIFT